MTAAPAIGDAVRVLVEGLGGQRNGSGWKARCPVHDDHTPSLSIKEGDDGRPLVHCHAGCAQDDVLADLRRRELWPSAERRSGPAPQARTTLFKYVDAKGEHVATHKRIDLPNGEKRMPWLKPDGTMSDGAIK